MFISSKYAFLALRLGLAVVFLWWGIDMFRHPTYWVTSGPLGGWRENLTNLDLLQGLRLAYITSVFMVLAGLSLLLQIFHKTFSVLAILWLVVMLVISGVNAVTARDFALIGALLAVALWPMQRERY